MLPLPRRKTRSGRSSRFLPVPVPAGLAYPTRAGSAFVIQPVCAGAASSFLLLGLNRFLPVRVACNTYRLMLSCFILANAVIPCQFGTQMKRNCNSFKIGTVLIYIYINKCTHIAEPMWLKQHKKKQHVYLVYLWAHACTYVYV